MVSRAAGGGVLGTTGRMLSLVGLLSLLVTQPFGGLAIVLHEHGGDHHGHVVAQDALAAGPADQAEQDWHGIAHAGLEGRGDVLEPTDCTGLLDLASGELSLVILADLAFRCPGGPTATAPDQAPGCAAIPASVPWGAPGLWSAAIPPWQRSPCSSRSGIPALLLRGHALLL